MDGLVGSTHINCDKKKNKKVIYLFSHFLKTKKNVYDCDHLKVYRIIFFIFFNHESKQIPLELEFAFDAFDSTWYKLTDVCSPFHNTVIFLTYGKLTQKVINYWLLDVCSKVFFSHTSMVFNVCFKIF